MTKESLHKEYSKWIAEEKLISDEAYRKFKAQGSRLKTQVSQKGKVLGIKFGYKLIRFTAAAVLVLAVGTSMWIMRDSLFNSKPNYSEEQIALSYEHAVKALSVCANSLSSEMDKLQDINQIPKSFDNIKKLGNVINN